MTTEKITTVFICDKCGKEVKQEHYDFTTGYCTNDKKEKICYACYSEGDKEYMREKGKITLYMVDDKPGYKGAVHGLCSITNWSGELRFDRLRYRKGRHNIAGSRYDVDFVFEGFVWHGVNYGENSQIIHCKKTRRAV